MCRTSNCGCTCGCCNISSADAALADMQRLLSHLTYAVSGCLIWTGPVNDQGYGRLKVRGQKVSAHRWAYELLVGPIPEGLTIDHLCRNKVCLNPAHLDLVTASENARRAAFFRRLRMHCRNGHELTTENTRIDTRGNRNCKACAVNRRQARTRLLGRPLP